MLHKPGLKHKRYEKGSQVAFLKVMLKKQLVKEGNNLSH